MCLVGTVQSALCQSTWPRSAFLLEPARQIIDAVWTDAKLPKDAASRFGTRAVAQRALLRITGTGTACKPYSLDCASLGAEGYVPLLAAVFSGIPAVFQQAQTGAC